MNEKKGFDFLVFGIIVVSIAAVFTFAFQTMPFHVSTPIKQSLVSINKISAENQQPAEDCSSEDCQQKPIPETELITITLTDVQLTALVNTTKPKNSLFDKPRLEFKNDLIFAQIVSYYPFAPGNISAVARIENNRIIIDALYIGNAMLPDAITRVLQRKANLELNDALFRNNTLVHNMELRQNTLLVETTIPKNSITLSNGVLTIVN